MEKSRKYGPSANYVRRLRLEHFPIEVLEEIAKHLAPQDLAHLCAASCEYREIFNRDSFWKPRCSLELEEPLRTTPCLVKPKFVNPEIAHSTLTPISKWRLAFMRENRLWNNWRTDNYIEVEYPGLSKVCFRQFLTKDLIVGASECCIEIWDVSKIPADLVVKKDIDSEFFFGCWLVVRTTILLFIAITFVKVFYIDITKKSIDLKHHINMEEMEDDLLPDTKIDKFVLLKCENCVVKDNTFIRVSSTGSVLKIFDLDSGLKLKEEVCPVVTEGKQRANIVGMITSKTCDNVVVVIQEVDADSQRFYHHYIYSPQQLAFLPFTMNRVVASHSHHIAVHGCYLAITEEDIFKLYNYYTSEIFHEETMNLSLMECKFIKVLSNKIIFIAMCVSPSLHVQLKVFSFVNNQTLKEKYFLKGKFFRRRCKSLICKVINNFVTVYDRNSRTHLMLEMSGKLLIKLEIPYEDLVGAASINQLFTIKLRCKTPCFSSILYYYW